MKIHITCAPQETLQFAAKELERYLCRMLLAQKAGSCRFTLTANAAGPDTPEEFAVDIPTPGGGTITGNGPRAVLLAVYDYLRVLGCRFLAPGAENEVIPAIQPAALVQSYRRQASFRHRGVCIEGADSRENIMDFIDWLPKVGYNSFFLQFRIPYAFLARWYHHEGNPLHKPEAFTVENAQTIMAEAEAEIARRGLLLHKVGHGWTGQVLGYPALDWKPVPPSLQHKAHPFAALRGGKRTLHLDIPADTNLCYADPAAIHRFAELVVDYARHNPTTDYLHIWLADEYNNLCECEACRTVTLADQYVHLLNELDRRLTEEALPTRLVFLLYQELLWPPMRERLHNPGRFVLMFAPISRTFEASYQWTDSPVLLPAFHRNATTLPNNPDENLAFLRAWQQCFAGDSFIYDYPLGRAHYGDPGYMHMARTIYSDIQKLRQLGLQGYISCQELRAALPTALPNYIMGLTLLDSSQNVEALIEEYCAAAYGEQGQAAKACLQTLSAHQCCDYINGIGPRQNPHVARRMAALAQACQAFLAQMPAGSGPFWRRLPLHLQNTKLLATAVAHLAGGDAAEANRAWNAFREQICRLEPELQPYLDVYRVLEVTQKYTGFTG